METSFTLQAVLKWGALKTKKSTLLSAAGPHDVSELPIGGWVT